MDFIHGRPAGVEGGRGPALRGFVPLGWLVEERERFQSFHGRDISLSSRYVDGFLFSFFFPPPSSFQPFLSYTRCIRTSDVYGIGEE